MADLSKIQKPSTQEDIHTSNPSEEKKIDQSAQHAAEKAGKTQKKFDQDHDIFTK